MNPRSVGAISCNKPSVSYRIPARITRWDRKRETIPPLTTPSADPHQAVVKSRTFVAGRDFDLSYDLSHHIRIKNNILRDEPQPAFYWNTLHMNRPYDSFEMCAMSRKVLTSA